MRRLPDTVERVGTDGSAVRVPVRQVAVGDRLRIHAGEVNTRSASGAATAISTSWAT